MPTPDLTASPPIWESDLPPTFPALAGQVEADVCVVGLGGSGLACIDELLGAGCTVVGLDAGPVAGAAAGRNGGLLRAGLASFHHEARRRYGASRASHLYALTIDERERLIARLPGAVRRCGYVRLGHDAAEAADCREHLESLREDGFEAEPWVGTEGTGLIVPGDAATNPLVRCHREAADVAQRGARLFERSAAERVRPRRVETAGGVVRCRIVIVALDGALPEVLPRLADRVRPARLQMLAAAPDGRVTLPTAGGTRWGWDYWQRMEDGRTAFGGCRDAGGDAEWTSHIDVTTPVQDALELRFRELTGVSPVVTHRWAATVGYTEDGLPVLEQVDRGVWAVGGYSGTGNLVGAVCARAAARMALGVQRVSPLE